MPNENQTRTKSPSAWKKVLLTQAALTGVPTFLYGAARTAGVSLFPLHAAVATLFLISATMVFVETTTAAARRFATPLTPVTRFGDRVRRWLKRRVGWLGAQLPAPTGNVPRSTLIVAAYLPNEAEIIEETLAHVLGTVRRPEDGLEVILAYNTPVRLAVEDRLLALAARSPELRVLRVEGSQSKAANLNAALEIATGELVGILDADHHPSPDCLARAWRWLEREYDVVQGRSVIRNHDVNLLTRVVAMEFECMYGLNHPARSLLVDTAIFGGSNGYWRAQVLRRVRFDTRMMTEDIDASARALLAGVRIVSDRSIVSSELAPTEFSALCAQRKRWAQGWLQVTLCHQSSFWRTRALSWRQKLYWTYLLSYRELHAIITWQVLPIFLSLLLCQNAPASPLHGYLALSAAVTWASGPYQTLWATKNAVHRYPISYPLIYAGLAFLYTLLKAMITLVALYDQWRGHESWVVTRRGSLATGSRKEVEADGAV